MQGSRLAPARSVRLAENRCAVLSTTSVTRNHIASSCASESRAPALHNGHIHHFVLVPDCAGASQSGSPGRLGTASAQLFVVHRRGTNCACGISSVFAMSSTCPCPTACMISTIFEIFLIVRHLSLCCMFISFNCTCVVSTVFWRCRLHCWSVCPLRRIAGT